MASSSDNIDSLCWSRNDLRRLTNEQLKLMKPRMQIETAFDHFNIEDPSFLEESDGRTRCSGCGQSRKYFCYTCYQSLDQFSDRTPKVQLPCRVDILKHPREIAGKSTAVHAPILAPEHATVYTHPDIPDYRTLQERVILIFPGPRSHKLEDYIAEHSSRQRRCSCGGAVCSEECSSTAPESPGLPFDRAVLIDCTWNQVKRIVLDERVSGLPRVEISSHQTLFWRYQTGKPSTYLATIEALYYFVLAVHKLQEHSPDRGRRLQRKAGEKRDGSTEDEIEMTTGIDCEDKNDCGSDSVSKGSKSESTLTANKQGEGWDLPLAANLQQSHTMDHKAEQHGTECIDPVFSNGSAIELHSLDEGDDPVSVLETDLEGINISKNELQVIQREVNTDDSVGIVNDRLPKTNGFSAVPVTTKRIASSAADEIDPSREKCALLIKDQSEDNNGLYTDACCHQYDNLLFFFKFMFYKIHNLYGSDNLRAYK